MEKDTTEITPSTEEKRHLSVQEAGRKGGNAVKRMYGEEHYARIGRIGGSIIAARGPEYFSRIGKMGGEAVRDKYGPDFFSDIGKKGGEMVKSKNGPEYFSRIGKMGGEAQRHTDRRRKPAEPDKTAE